MWGKADEIEEVYNLYRITPTRVGKRVHPAPALCQAEDYPHPCGEKRAADVYLQSDTGLPPPVWGKGENALQFYKRIRITPTRVGKRDNDLTLAGLK